MVEGEVLFEVVIKIEIGFVIENVDFVEAR